jgi:hypothetical protein
MRPAWLLMLAVSTASAAQYGYYRHVVFDNSLTPERHYHSGGRVSEPSTLRLVDGRLPVEGGEWKTPPNALRLDWRSDPAGGWEAEVRVDGWRNRPHFEGDALSFWCYSPEGIGDGLLPRIQLGDADRGFSVPIEWTGSVPARRWTRVELPLRLFASASYEPFNAARLRSVSFLQGRADGANHTLLVDEIKIDSGGTPSGPPGAPTGLTAKAYERHIDISWTPSPGAHVQRYVIYRSIDGGEYRPVGIQTPLLSRFTDWLGEPGRKASYRVTASDRWYRESPATHEVSAATRALSDEELLDMVQEAHFRYYWEGAHPHAGMALENIPGDEHTVALGASGFGVMAILAGAHRGFITRDQAVERMTRMTSYLAKADRYKGVWPHFLDGRTGKTLPVFGKYDSGGDLVETAFLVQGLLAARQFFDRENGAEKSLRDAITRLWREVDWSWYRRTPQSDFLFWHWSPVYSWAINHKLIGFNETMIVYLLAMASPTHAVPASLYYSGWASQSEEAARYRRGWGETDDGSRYANGSTYFGIRLLVGVGRGGPLFFTHYSYMGFDPRTLRDRYTNYFENNRAIALINHAYCNANPKGHPGYGGGAWGLTASDGPGGYRAHEPMERLDDGTMTPTGALSSFPYTPAESMQALKHFYREMGQRIWGEYGFRDAYNLREGWIAPIFMGLNQAPITVMIENHRSELIWKLFMANPEIKEMLERLEKETAGQR